MALALELSLLQHIFWPELQERQFLLPLQLLQIMELIA
jgi:hypothetical protein